MPSINDYIEPGKRILARRLDQLCSTLELLGGRLRATIANAVGETISGIVRDAALHVFDDATQYLADSAHRSDRVRDTLARHEYGRDERGYWADQEPDREPDYEDPPDRSAPASERLPTALSAGLQAASWWLRRWSGQGRIVTTLAVGIVAAGIAYIGRPLAALVLGLAGTATQFTSLSDAFATGASTFGRSDPP